MLRFGVEWTPKFAPKLFVKNTVNSASDNYHSADIGVRSSLDRKTLDNLQLFYILVSIMDLDKQLINENNKVRLALKYEMLISNIASILNSSIDFFIVLDEVLNIITTSLSLKTVQLLSLIPEIDTKIINKKWLHDYYLSNSEKTLISSINVHISESRPLFWNDYSEILEANRIFLCERKILSFAVFPLKVNSLILGFITFESDEASAWNTKHYSLFSTISNLLANALDKHKKTETIIHVERQNAENIRLIEQSSRLATIGLMTSGITHEINQPLNAIKVIADSILYQQKVNPYLYPPELMQKINDISKATERINGISQQIKKFCVSEKANIHEEFELHETIKYSLSLLNKQTNIHDIVIELQFYPYKINVVGNKIQFEQIIINLCMNAIQSLKSSQKEKKKIMITTDKNDERKQITISDNGTGINPNDFDRLFDPFFSTKTGGENMGLGLAVVKMFIDGMGWDIKIGNNENGEGVEVELVVT